MHIYICSLERMLCKSELENRFLIAARKKSSDFAPTHLYSKRVVHATLGKLCAEIVNFFERSLC